MMDLPGTTEAQNTNELAAVETGDKVVFGDRKQPLEVTGYSIELRDDGVRARVTVEGARGGVYRLKTTGDAIGVERKTTDYYTQRDEWESRGDVALDTFEVVEEGDGDERSDAQLSLLDFELGDDVEVEAADGLETSGTVARINRNSWSVKVWVDREDEDSVAVSAERDRGVKAKVIGWRPDDDVVSYEEDVELRAARELAADGGQVVDDAGDDALPFECDGCGARYHGETAAEGCCSQTVLQKLAEKDEKLRKGVNPGATLVYGNDAPVDADRHDVEILGVSSDVPDDLLDAGIVRWAKFDVVDAYFTGAVGETDEGELYHLRRRDGDVLLDDAELRVLATDGGQDVAEPELPDEVNGWTLEWSAHGHVRYEAQIDVSRVVAKVTGVVADEHNMGAYATRVAGEKLAKTDDRAPALREMLAWLREHTPEETVEIRDADDREIEPVSDGGEAGVDVGEADVDDLADREAESDVFVLVACSKSKADGELPAREKYAGTYAHLFRKSRDYAEMIGADYAILSGKYGVLAPDVVIDDYDVSVDDRDADEWAEQVEAALQRVDLERYSEVRVLAGKDYREPLADYFAELDVDVTTPLAHCSGNGKMMAELNDWMDELEGDDEDDVDVEDDETGDDGDDSGFEQGSLDKYMADGGVDISAYRGAPPCQEPECTDDAHMVSDYVHCLEHSTTGGEIAPPPVPIEAEGIATDDFTFYFGASCGSSRKTLRQLEEPNVCLSYGTRDKTPWDGIESLMVDSGGYSLIRRGDGEYPDEASDYLAFLEDVDADFFMTRDVPAAPRVLSKLDNGVTEAIARTVENTVETLDALGDYDVDAEPVAVLQGTTPEEYVSCYHELVRAEAVTSRVAIGSLKKKSVGEKVAVIEAVREAVDDEIELHGLGVEAPALEIPSVRAALSSADSSRYIATARWRGNRDEHPPRLRDDEPKTSWHESARAYLDMRGELREALQEDDETADADVEEGSEQPEVVADGGFVTEPDGAEWCPECQRRRVSCAHQGDDARADGGTKAASGVDASMSYQDRARELEETTVLSSGEADVAALKEQGKGHQAIADELGLSKSTVDTISSRIQKKREKARATVDELGDF